MVISGVVVGVVNLAHAKACLSELLDRAEAGEEIVITRHGRPVVKLSAVSPPKQALPDLTAFRARLPRLRDASAVLLREARDDSR